MSPTKLRSLFVLALLLIASSDSAPVSSMVVMSSNFANSSLRSQIQSSTGVVERLVPVEEWPLRFTLESDGTILGVRNGSSFDTGLTAKREDNGNEPWYRGNIDILWLWAYTPKPVVYILEPRNFSIPSTIQVKKKF